MGALPEPEVAVLHAAVAGRVRLSVPALHGNAALSPALQSALSALPGLGKVRASSVTGTLVLGFDPPWTIGSLIARVAKVTREVRHEIEVEPAPAQRRTFWRSSRRARAAFTQPRAEQAFHALTRERALQSLGTDPERGLSAEEVVVRRERFGRNSLQPADGRSDFALFVAQFHSLPTLLLVGSAALSALTGGLAEAGAILIVVGANAAIGFATERSAERIIRSLEPNVSREALVLRAGETESVAVDELVPGDLVLLASGALVPADARVVRAESLLLDESALTGESGPVTKTMDAVERASVPLAERHSMVYRGTRVLSGTGCALVVATGQATELGRIQAMLGSIEPPQTPLQRELAELGGRIALFATGICGLVFAVGLWRGRSTLEMLRTAVSLGVAAVPEGLPTVALSALGLGIRHLQGLNVTVRRLAAVETLGAIEVMCLDKTGTITERRMVVREVFVRGERLAMGSRSGAENGDLERLLRLCVLCSEAEVVATGDGPELRGSPTEVALVRLALDHGIEAERIRERHPVLRVQGRAEGKNYMATVHALPDSSRVLVAVKGSPLEVLARCGAELRQGRELPLSEAGRRRIESENARLAGGALRVLGFACIELPSEDDGVDDRPWTWVGLVGIEDPPRPNVAESLERLRMAGIATLIITGDQAATAGAIGREIKVSGDAPLRILDTGDLEGLGAEQFASAVGEAHVFARVAPADKLRIVQALQEKKRVVAMTGDGINDGPALKAADVGIAMGASGSHVARDVADVVLGDDDLARLVLAVEQGRTIYADIKKAVHFVLATNLSELLLTFFQVAFSGRPTLSPMQLLWLNVLTDIFPELALVAEPAEEDLLTAPPRAPGKPMFAAADLARVVVEGAMLALTAVAARPFSSERHRRDSSFSFLALTSAQLLFAFSARSEHHSVFDRTALPRNPYVPATIGASLTTQVLASFVPQLRRMLGVHRVGVGELAGALAAALATLLASEGVKCAVRPTSAARADHLR